VKLSLKNRLYGSFIITIVFLCINLSLLNFFPEMKLGSTFFWSYVTGMLCSLLLAIVGSFAFIANIIELLVKKIKRRIK
jgi:hypothetical protein